MFFASNVSTPDPLAKPIGEIEARTLLVEGLNYYIKFDRDLRKARTSSKRLKYQEFLNCDLAELFTTEEEYSHYFYNLICLVLQKFLHKGDQGWIVEHATYFDNDMDMEESPMHKNIPIDYEKETNTFWAGSQFVIQQSSQQKLIFELVPPGFQRKGRLLIIGNKTQQQEIETLLEHLKAKMKESDIFKNKKLELLSRGALGFLKPSSTNWQDIIIESELREEIEKNVIHFFDHREFYEANGVPLKRGIILNGAPGTGKTLLTKIVMNSIPFTVIYVSSKSFDEGSEGLSFLFDCARQLSPALIVLEDLDLFGQARSHNKQMGFLGELLYQLDSVSDNTNLIIIATTNDVTVVDEALKNRPSRFDRQLNFPMPNRSMRLQILQLFAKNAHLQTQELATILDQTEGFSGAHIRELVISAIIEARHARPSESGQAKIGLPEFQTALKKMQQFRKVQTLGFTSKTEVRQEEPESSDDSLPWDEVRRSLDL